MTEPQLSAEMEKRFDEQFCLAVGGGLVYKGELPNGGWMDTLVKRFLATALEEQKREYEVKLKEAIEKLKEQEYQSVDLPYDENTFEHGVNEGLFQGIVALEAILNGKE